MMLTLSQVTVAVNACSWGSQPGRGCLPSASLWEFATQACAFRVVWLQVSNRCSMCIMNQCMQF